jgi:hypothetical protein
VRPLQPFLCAQQDGVGRRRPGPVGLEGMGTANLLSATLRPHRVKWSLQSGTFAPVLSAAGTEPTVHRDGRVRRHVPGGKFDQRPCESARGRVVRAPKAAGHTPSPRAATSIERASGGRRNRPGHELFPAHALSAAEE